MKKILFLSVLMLGYALVSFSQIDKMRDQIEDADAIEDGQFTLRFFNAETGGPVSDAKIIIQDLKTLTTDMEGKIRFDILEDGGVHDKFHIH